MRVAMVAPDRTAEEPELDELLEEALARPGVRDLMELYRRWWAAEAAMSLHRHLAVQRVVFSSDSSAGRDRR